MMKDNRGRYFNISIISLVSALVFSCEPPQRNCSDFHDGHFSYTEVIDGKEHTTEFSRTGDLEISTYKGVVDSASVKWINDCEYVLKNLNPKNTTEEKPLHLKILTTSGKGYTFEYSVMGDAKKIRGTVIKL